MNTVRIDFLVQGSAPEPYRVMFQRTGTNLTATCTCPAGEIGQYCKHRLRILGGEATGIVSSNASAVPEVQSLLVGTDVEVALAELRAAEEDHALTTKLSMRKVTVARKRLARALSS